MTRAGIRHRISVRQHLRPAPLKGERLRALVRKAVTRLADGPSDVRVLIVGDADIERWNRAFLGRAGATNVISFPEEETPAAGAAARLAGDILVSAPTCLRQTKGWPGPREERVLFFIVHGLLHLLGYDHENGGAQARRMRRKEMDVYRSILRKDRG